VLSRTKRTFLADIQALRLRISREADQRNARTIAIVGLWPSCGATTLSVWLARSLAAEGHSTLLVDANTARPALHKPWKLSAAPGINEIMSGNSDEEAAVRQVDIDGLQVLPLGAAPKPTKPNSNSSWNDGLASLSAEHKFILVDAGTPEYTSTLEVAGACDLTVAIAQAGTVRREAIKGRLALLGEHGATTLGLILNKRHYSIPEFVYRRL